MTDAVRQHCYNSTIDGEHVPFTTVALTLGVDKAHLHGVAKGERGLKPEQWYLLEQFADSCDHNFLAMFWEAAIEERSGSIIFKEGREADDE